jgi:FkbM family methyltransferase
MHPLERWSLAIRHSSWLGQFDWLWDRLRPYYDQIVTRLSPQGLDRTLNGCERMRILPQFRSMSEVYEPDVWKHIFAQARPGDIIADVGAYIGLYTVALAKRVGSDGQVIAFEPDSENFDILRQHVAINSVQKQVKLVQAAVSDHDGVVSFNAGNDSQSHIDPIPCENNQSVAAACLDTVFADNRLDILKIDVEGYEEAVLKGGANLLIDPKRCPRIIYIEVHPYAWDASGTMSLSLLGFLADRNYMVMSLAGQQVKQIQTYGEIIAIKQRASDI